MRRWLVVVAFGVMSLLAVPLAAEASRDPLVRPGVGIGQLRLGMTLAAVRRVLGGDLLPYRSKALREGRFLELQTRDALWRVAFIGYVGRERLARIRSGASRAHTREGVGVGTDVAAIPRRMRPHRPECRNTVVFLKHHLYDARTVRCALIGPESITMFDGQPECAVEPIRYQGCPKIRVPVRWVVVESRTLARLNLSWWFPAPDGTGLRPPG